MKLGRQMRTPAQVAFWREVDRSAKEVEEWPAWLRGVREEQTKATELEVVPAKRESRRVKNTRRRSA
jgi:hypothetical protein